MGLVRGGTGCGVGAESGDVSVFELVDRKTMGSPLVTCGWRVTYRGRS